MVSLRVMLVPIEAMEVAFIMVVRGGGGGSNGTCSGPRFYVR